MESKTLPTAFMICIFKALEFCSVPCHDEGIVLHVLHERFVREVLPP